MLAGKGKRIFGNVEYLIWWRFGKRPTKCFFFFFFLRGGGGGGGRGAGGKGSGGRAIKKIILFVLLLSEPIADLAQIIRGRFSVCISIQQHMLKNSSSVLNFYF